MFAKCSLCTKISRDLGLGLGQCLGIQVWSCLGFGTGRPWSSHGLHHGFFQWRVQPGDTLITTLALTMSNTNTHSWYIPWLFGATLPSNLYISKYVWNELPRRSRRLLKHDERYTPTTVIYIGSHHFDIFHESPMQSLASMCLQVAWSSTKNIMAVSR